MASLLCRLRPCLAFNFRLLIRSKAFSQGSFFEYWRKGRFIAGVDVPHDRFIGCRQKLLAPAD